MNVRAGKKTNTTDITIVGGGAVATATALAADARGMDTQLLMPATTAPATNRRRYALSQRSTRFLRSLGIDIALHPVMRFVLHAGGRQPLHLENDGKPLCEMADEPSLAAALDARLQQSGVKQETGDANWLATDDDAVHLRVGKREHRTALLAVADGARSTLASQLGIYGSMTDFRQHAIVADVTTEHIPSDTAAQWFGDNDIVALLPAGDGVFSLVWSTATAPEEDAVEDALRKRINIDDLTVQQDSVQRFPLRAATRAARVSLRVALLGDAAGVIHPLAGQGLNLGLADAETLIQCTHRRARGNLGLGLAAYSAARQPRHRQLQMITKFLLPSEQRVAALLCAARLPLMRQLAVGFANG